MINTLMIPVTKSFLPPKADFDSFLDRAWQDRWITNRGQLTKELESKLTEFLGVDNVLCTTNGTLPLQLALKLLGKKGEIITTPFSYVATLSSIVWENCTPVFVDIHPEYLTIDETKIESAITPQTTCILATHVYGNPCNVESISKLALKYNLKVIYDAAHAFGVEVDNQSVFKHGDIATCSFHATKIFHTGEGGALFANDPELLAPLFHFHNFGHNGPHNFHSVGINAKMSELQAALGLAVLPYFNEIKEKRKLICQMYLSELAGCNFQFLKIRENTNWNFSYFPIIFETEEQLLKVEKSLNNQQIFPRRYFYPSLNTLSYIQTKIIMPISESISKRILCLPIYHDLSPESISKISSIIKDQLIINSK